MRIQLDGVYSLDGFEEAISRITKNFRKKNNIQSIRNVNLYLNPLVHGGFVHLYDDTGNEIKHLILDYAKHRTFRPATDDLSVVETTKFKSENPDDS